MGQSNDLGRIDANADASAGNTMDRMGSGPQPMPAGVRNTFDGFTNGQVVERPGGVMVSAPTLPTTGSTPNLDSLFATGQPPKLTDTGAGNPARSVGLDATLDSLFPDHD